MEFEGVHIARHATSSRLAVTQTPRMKRTEGMADTERKQAKKAADMDCARFRKAFAVEAESMGDVGHTEVNLAVREIVLLTETIEAETAGMVSSSGRFA